MNKLVQLGAIWEKDPARGGNENTLFTGTVNSNTRIIVMRNTNKQEDKHPDAYIYLAPADNDRKKDKPKEDEGGYGGL